MAETKPRQRGRPTSSLVDQIGAARVGNPVALGEALEACRNYLLMIANEELGAEVQTKVAPSDLVQDTFLRAHQRFVDYRGQTEAEFRAWLRAILRNRVQDATRQYTRTLKREVGREADPNVAAIESIRDPRPSPSSTVGRTEYEQRLIRALAALPTHYQQVIELRSFERMSFAEVGQRMDRSEEAARQLWGRAIDRLAVLVQSPQILEDAI